MLLVTVFVRSLKLITGSCFTELGDIVSFFPAVVLESVSFKTIFDDKSIFLTIASFKHLLH